MEPLRLIVIVVGVVAAVCVILAVAYVRKLRTLRAAGSFIVSYRATTSDGWTEGYCVYGADSLSWHKFMSLKVAPVKTWTRQGMELARPVRRRAEDGTVWVDVAVIADGHRFFLFMTEADFNGLISWCEAAPPRPPRLGSQYRLD